jgi:two-component system response regulator MprA
MPTVLVVDDDERLLKMLQRTLSYEGLDVLTATNGRQALHLLREQQPDVAILDWLMPEMSGIQVLRQLRQEHDQTMVLMLTARDAIQNRVEGLESGADDYLVKPFAPAELVARVHALLRRTQAQADAQALSYGELHLDPVAYRARRGELMLHPRQVLTREQILSHVWGYDFGGDANVVEVYVGYLRRKMEGEGLPRLIQTVRGVGYVLREDG